MNAEDINKGISIGAFRRQKMIGFVLHGERKIEGVKKAYNAGTGVNPIERGQALTKRMYDILVPEFKRQGFDEVLLEVISDNIPAIKSYEKIGFRHIRMLNCYSGEPLVMKINEEVKIERFQNSNFEELCKIGEMEPTWQNSSVTIENLGEYAYCFLAHIGKELCGYTVLNTSNDRILQIAVKKDMRNRLIGSSLLNYLFKLTSNSISIINIDADHDSIIHFLESRNLTKSLSQKEMKLKIPKK
ncbi:GNAT family N-acetyltransferase [Euzebyella marina]|nr:GNAT family N-acetyltransferase [Euzebyella marina]